MRRLIISAVLLTAVFSPPVAAQRAMPPVFPRFAPQLQNDAHADAPAAPFAPAFGDPKDYRYEGAIAGAVLFGSGLAYLGHGFCESSDGHSDCDWETVKIGVGGAVLGGLLGLLIGGMMTKAGDK